MRVLIISPGEDTAGVGFALKVALERHTGVEAVEAHRVRNYIGYPEDVFWPQGDPVPEALQRIFDAADVVHVMIGPDAIMPFCGWESKPIVLHHHGTALRRFHPQLRRWAREHGARQLVSTPDLLLVAPEAEWLPNPVDAAEMRRVRGAAMVSVDVVQTPSSRRGKSTELLEATVARMTPRPTLLVADKLPHGAALAAKAIGRVYFDQLALGYGVSGIEAMAMGIPVVAGATGEPITEMGIPAGRHLPEMMAKMWGYLPFLLAEPGTLQERLADACETAGPLAREAGRHHIEAYHDEAVVAWRLARIYDEVAA